MPNQLVRLIKSQSHWGVSSGGKGGEADEFGEEGEEGEAGEAIQEGSMPPAVYLSQHSEAKLTAAESQQLISGLEKSLSQR